MLGILAVALLAGTGNLWAQRKKGRPKADQRRKQVEEGPQKQKGLRPAQRRFDGWLAALTKAYRENDGEKMGQLLRNMNQRRRRQRAQKGKVEGRPERWRERKEGRRWHGRGSPAGGQGFEWEGKGRGGGAFRREGRGKHFRDRAFRGEGRRKHAKAFRGKGWRKHAKGFRGEDVGRCCPRFRGRGMGKRGPHGEARERFARGGYELGEWGRGPRRRGMGRAGRGFHGRGRHRWHQEPPPKSTHDRSRDESDFDWDW